VDRKLPPYYLFSALWKGEEWKCNQPKFSLWRQSDSHWRGKRTDVGPVERSLIGSLIGSRLSLIGSVCHSSGRHSSRLSVIGSLARNFALPVDQTTLRFKVGQPRWHLEGGHPTEIEFLQFRQFQETVWKGRYRILAQINLPELGKLPDGGR
jgi:hypothetical protein